MTARDNVTLINDMSNKGFERLNALGEINLRAWEKLASRQMDTLNLFLEQGVRQMKLAVESKGYSEYLKGQVEVAKDLSTRMNDEAKANLQMASELRDDYRAWFEQGMSDVSAEMRKAAPSA